MEAPQVSSRLTASASIRTDATRLFIGSRMAGQQAVLLRGNGSHRQRLLWLVIFCGLLCALPTTRAQRAGNVDPGFGASLGLAGNVTGVLPQADGKVIVRGYFPKSIARLNANGSADGDFDPGSGAGSVPGSPQDFAIDALAAQSDGKIIVGGEFNTFNGVARQAVARLNADGSLDASFDPGTNIGGVLDTVTVNAASSVAVQADGKILVLSSSLYVGGGTPNYTLTRLNPNGSLDTGFPVITGTQAEGTVVAVQPDGKILVGGFFGTFNGFSTSGVARLNPDGSVDTGFTSALVGGSANSLALQPDGKIVVGLGFNYFGSGPSVARLNPDGSLDAGFNAGTGANSDITTVAVQPDGKVVFGGYFSTYNGVTRSYVARLNGDGSLDSGFDPGANGHVLGIVVQPDGKTIFGGGFTIFGGISRDGVARLNNDDTVDVPFQPDGTAGPNSTVSHVLEGPDGKSIIAGVFTTINGQAHPNIARLNADGSLDLDFQPEASFIPVGVQTDGKLVGNDANGVVRLNANGTPDSAFNAATGFTASGLQSDGKIIVQGAVGLARLNADGSLDSGFTQAVDLTFRAFQPDGKLLAIPTDYQFSGDMGVRRLNPDGTLDRSFVYGLNPYVPFLTTITVQPDGKILLAAFNLVNHSQPVYVFTRLNADGGVDGTFQVAQGSGHIGAIAVQADGTILIGGDFTTCNGSVRNGLARLGTDGTLDATFDPGANTGAAVSDITLQADGQILIGGTFNEIGGIVRNYVARLDDAGAVDTTFLGGTGPSSLTAAVLQPDGKVIVGGQVAGGVMRLNADGSLDPSFDVGTGASGGVSALALQADGSVLVGGSFTGFDGTAAAFLVRLLADGSLDAGFAPTIDGLVATCVVQTDGRILIGGDFNQVDGRPRSGLARLNADGTIDPGFTADVDPEGSPASHAGLAYRSTRGGQHVRQAVSAFGGQKVRSLAYVPGNTGQPDELVVGGLFSQVAGVARNGLAKLILTGGTSAVDGAFDPGVGPDATVQALVVQADGSLLVGGDFTSVGGAARLGLARLFSNGSVDTSFDAALQGTATHPVSVHSLGMVSVASSGTTATVAKILVGGSFTRVGNVSQQAYARLLVARGTTDPNFKLGTGADGIVNALVPQPDGRTIIAGAFDSVDGQPHRAVARLLGGEDTLAPVVNSAISATAQAGRSFTYQISGTNTPTSFGATGLPTGLTADPASGLISGTPAAAGTFRITLSATNSDGTGTGTLTLVVTPAQPVATLMATTPSVVAGSGDLGEFTLSLSPAPARDMVVNFTIRGTAVNGTDYVLLKGTKKIKAGSPGKPIKVIPLGDGGGAGVKHTVVLTLQTGDGYTVGTTGKIKVRIYGR